MYVLYIGIYLRSTLALVGNDDNDSAAPSRGEGGGSTGVDQRAIWLEGQLVREIQRAWDVASTEPVHTLSQGASLIVPLGLETGAYLHSFSKLGICAVYTRFSNTQTLH